MVECESGKTTSFLLIGLSFNRYMVECELFTPLLLKHPPLRVLIDTWWNVNTLKSPDAKTDSSFNRYMVEC